MVNNDNKAIEIGYKCVICQSQYLTLPEACECGGMIEPITTLKPTAEQTGWVLRKLLDHLEEGGTFRYLIYDRLGYAQSDYSELYLRGGQDLSNIFNDLRTCQNCS